MSSNDAGVPAIDSAVTETEVSLNGHKIASPVKNLKDPNDLCKSIGDQMDKPVGEDKPPDESKMADDSTPIETVSLSSGVADAGSTEQKGDIAKMDKSDNGQGVAAEEDNSKTALKSDDSKPADEGDDSKQVVEGDDSKQVVEGDDSKQVVEGDDSKHVVERDDSKKVVEGDNSKQVVEGDDSKQVVEDDDSKLVVEGDDSKQVVEGDDSKQVVKGDDSKQVVEGDDFKSTVEGGKSEPVAGGNEAITSIDGDAPKEAVGGDDSIVASKENDSESVVKSKDSKPTIEGDDFKPAAAQDTQTNTIQASSDSVVNEEDQDTAGVNVDTGNAVAGQQANGQVKDVQEEPMEAEEAEPVEGTENQAKSDVKQSADDSSVEPPAGEASVGKRKSRSKGSPPKQTARDQDKEEEMDTEQSAQSGDTPVLGLLERPVEIQTGKRSRRKVDRLAENIATPPTTSLEKKKLVIPEGEGVKLGDCPAIEEVVNKTKADELKAFHKILYGVPGKTAAEVKRNIRGFCGWSFSLEDGEHKKKVQMVSRVNLPMLKTWCGMLKLPVTGSKDVLVERLITYLMKPTAEGKELQAKAEAGKRKRRSAKAMDEGGDAEESPEEPVESDEDEQPSAKKRKTAAKKTPARKTRTPAKSGRGRGKKSAEIVDESDDEEVPPTDAVLRKQIEKILSTADLEVVTMETVRQQILDMYSNFDLNHKRDFIKATVKEILGA